MFFSGNSNVLSQIECPNNEKRDLGKQISK